MITSSTSDRYEYEELDERKQTFLINELNEYPVKLNAHIESFRRWVKSMPHIRCPTNAKFLLRFLRVSKFDHEKAQKRLDNFCTMRSSPRGSPDFFEYFQRDDSVLESFLKNRFQIPLGKTSSGELIVLYRWKCLNSLFFTKAQLAQFMFMTLDILAEDENSQTHGIWFVSDLEGVDRKVIEFVADGKAVKKFYRVWQDSYPFRIKGQIFYNAPPIFDILFRIFQFFMSGKIKSRTHSISQDMKKVMELVPGLEKIFPMEYNGLGLSVDECADRWNEQFKEYYSNIHPLRSIHVDESKRPKETLDYLFDHPDYVDEVFGKEGTYTKFDAF